MFTIKKLKEMKNISIIRFLHQDHESILLTKSILQFFSFFLKDDIYFYILNRKEYNDNADLRIWL